MGTFHEVLPGNLVFFHFYYIGTQEIEYLDYTTLLYVKNWINTWNYSKGAHQSSRIRSDQDVKTLILPRD